MAKSIPEGYSSVTPYLIVNGAAQALDFYKRALGAMEMFRMEAPGGKVGHAEIRIGDSVIMLADEYPEMGHRGPRSLGGSSVSIMLYVDDVDERVKRATEAGAKVVKPLANQFYGDRSATLEDPFGHVWTIATHVEDVPPEGNEAASRGIHEATGGRIIFLNPARHGIRGTPARD